MFKKIAWVSLSILLAITLAGCSEQKSTTIKIEAKDKSSETIYSALLLDVPAGAVEGGTNVKITSVAATLNDQFVGGHYYLSPKDLVLKKPATVSITYNDAAISLYQKTHPDFSESSLTLAYYNEVTKTYEALESNLDLSTKTVSGRINKLYSEGVMIFEKREIDKVEQAEKYKSTINDPGLDLKDCQELIDTRLRNDCFLKIAITEKNPDLCEKIKSEREFDKQNCYFNLAKELKKPELCDLVSELSKSSCLQNAQ